MPSHVVTSPSPLDYCNSFRTCSYLGLLWSVSDSATSDFFSQSISYHFNPLLRVHQGFSIIFRINLKFCGGLQISTQSHPMALLSYYFFFLAALVACIWKFPGQGSHLSHGFGNTKSLTHCAIGTPLFIIYCLSSLTKCTFHEAGVFVC